jgi:hypothetical protein
MFRSWYAIGIGTGLGLALLQSNSASALQPDSRHHARFAFQHRAGEHRLAARKGPARKESARREAARTEKDSNALTSLKTEVRDLRRQVVEVEMLRQELSELKEKIWGPTPLPLVMSVLPQPQSAAVVEPKQVTLKVPDLSEPYRPRAPVNPASASLPALIEERAGEALKPKSAVEEAKAYLIETATPGYTMVRQGVPVAIGRLHPDLIVKLAEAIKLARASGLTNAGVFSAYRPPAFGIGGFGDKFNSLHSYGLAVDMTGVGGPGSRFARLWQSIVQRVGLYLPYGPNNRAEFNHTQLIPTKMAPNFLRATITASAPKDLTRMWIASGIRTFVSDTVPGKAPSLASATTVPAVLSGDADNQAPAAPQQPLSTAPRRTDARRPGKRATARIAVAPRATGRKAGARKATTKGAAKQATKE